MNNRRVFLMPEAEWKMVQNAAALEMRSVSQWVRIALLRQLGVRAPDSNITGQQQALKTPQQIPQQGYNQYPQRPDYDPRLDMSNEENL